MAAKKAESDGPFSAKFKQIRQQLDENNDRRERINRASREVTQSSKKAIFKLHRIASTSTSNNKSILTSTSEDLSKVRSIIAGQIASELDAENYLSLHHAYSSGLQEYIEARTFLHFMKEGNLMSLKLVEEEIQEECRDKSIAFEMTVEISDYVLGIADLTGELMRRAIGSAASSDTTAASDIRRFLCELEVHVKRMPLASFGRNMQTKMRTLQQSRGKVEKACFDMVVRHSEFGPTAASETSLPPAKRAKVAK